MIVLLPGQASDHTAWDYSADPIKQFKMGFFHFSNNNLSIRKACAEDVGKYDLNATKSEDVDICFRVAQSPHWVALRERGSYVRHKARKTFSAFVKQMWGWGYHVGYPYSKTGIRGVYLYWLNSSTHKITLDIEIKRFPFLICMFFTDFHLAHLLLAVAVLSGLLGHAVFASVSGVLALPFIWRYCHDYRQTKLSFRKTCQLALVHYVANAVFMTAAISGALKYRVFLLPSSIFRPRGPEET